MTDAISRSRVLEALETEKGRVMAEKGNDWPFTGEILARAIDTACAFIKDIPAIDAVPVVHAEWKYKVAYTPFVHISNLIYCTVCRKWIHRPDGVYFNFCPNCGARMDAEVSNVPDKNAGKFGGVINAAD